VNKVDLKGPNRVCGELVYVLVVPPPTTSSGIDDRTRMRGFTSENGSWVEGTGSRVGSPFSGSSGSVLAEYMLLRVAGAMRCPLG
jgi:hypothetical protein